jgi:hypothetical protein
VETNSEIYSKLGIEMEFVKRYEGLVVNSVKGMNGGLNRKE